MSDPTRRRLVRDSAALGLTALAAPAARAVAANDKIGVACVGVRGRGATLLRSFADQPDCVITHICDVNEPVRRQRGEELRQRTGRMPELVNDYRTILEDKSVDVLVVATPDHWHALPTVHGCLAGKDVYVEKPASHNLREGKAAVAAARKRGRVVQVGTQIRSAAFMREAVAHIAGGALGKVIYGRAWETGRNGGVRLAPDGAPPPGLDYDLWLGPAPARPYNKTVVNGAWQWLFDFGCGDLGNDGVHRIDYCRWAMGLEGMPGAVSCGGGKFFFEDAQEWPDTMVVTYEYPGKVLQYEMRLWSKPQLFDAAEGAAVYGENGWVLLTNTSWKHFDAAGKVVKQGGHDLGQAQQAHTRNFLEAVKGRKPQSLNQEVYQGHVSTAMCHAGNIAWRTGKKLRFDPKSETFDDAAANRYLGREHRKGFELPDIA